MYTCRRTRSCDLLKKAFVGEYAIQIEMGSRATLIEWL